jgi:hypothetical protein
MLRRMPARVVSSSSGRQLGGALVRIRFLTLDSYSTSDNRVNRDGGNNEGGNHPPHSRNYVLNGVGT